MIAQTRSAPSGVTGRNSGAGANPAIGGAGSSRIVTLEPHIVKNQQSSLLLDQALAAEQRALASAAWHFERAARYLGWAGDNQWAAQRYREHVGEAEFQQRLAARHRQIAASLEGVTR